MSWQEKDSSKPEMRYAPSAEKVVTEEADNPVARANADRFIDQIYSKMDTSDYGPNTLVPTPSYITDRFGELSTHTWSHPGNKFTLQEAYGAAKRKLCYQIECASEIEPNRIDSIRMKNIGDMYILMQAIELAIPPITGNPPKAE